MTDLVLSAPRGFLRRRRFAVLLGALITLILISPLFGTDPRGETDVAMLFSLVVLGFAASSKRSTVALGLAAIWLLVTWLRPFVEDVQGEVVSDLILLAICAVAAESALRRALGAGKVDAEELCAAISAYVMMGVAWAAAYSVLFALQPGAFDLAAPDAKAPWSALLYFSFATLTTLGYGDVTPVSALARSWASVEAITGTIYLAILIAHLVSNFRGTRGDEI